MEFDIPLVRGTLIRRYMRFLADVTLADGRVVKSHCPNPGSMMGLKDPGLTVWLEPNDDPKKKLDWGWRLAQMSDGAMVGIDAAAANRVVAEAFRDGRIAELSGPIRTEVTHGDSRVDFTVGDTFVEVKSVTLKREGWAEFPDSVTKRGTKHLHALTDIVVNGGRAAMLYLVQRDDCTRFRLASDIDPDYARAFDAARAAGVRVMCYGTAISPRGISLTQAIPVDDTAQALAKRGQSD